jgi:hypothetical protein
LKNIAVFDVFSSHVVNYPTVFVGTVFEWILKSADVYFKLFDWRVETVHVGNCRPYKLTFCSLVLKLHVQGLLWHVFVLAAITWENRTGGMACTGDGSLYLRSMAVRLRRCIHTAPAPHSIRECVCRLSGICFVTVQCDSAVCDIHCGHFVCNFICVRYQVETCSWIKISHNSDQSGRCKQCSCYISVHCDTFELQSWKLTLSTTIIFLETLTSVV